VVPTAMMYMAVDGPRIVGAIELRGAVDGYGLNEPINVSPEYQRQRIGEQLWTMAAVWSKRRGDKGLRVWALDGNDKAMNFYKDRLPRCRHRLVGTRDSRRARHRIPVRLLSCQGLVPWSDAVIEGGPHD
jgi:GNAT superfamily N-acetyltransferase